MPRLPASSFQGNRADFRRLTPSVVWNLAHRPFSRMSHARRDSAVSARFAKLAIPRRPLGGSMCILGAFKTPNGLSRAARYELARLTRQFPHAELVDVSKGAGSELEIYARARADDPPGTAIFLMQPNLIWKHLRGVPADFLSRSYRIALAVWELPYFPPGWSFIDDFFHEYWTPTEFSAEALRQGTSLRVSVVPHPVNVGPRACAPKAPGEPFRGLAIMDLSTCPARKNPWAHIEAWQKAFGDRTDAMLTMKVRFSARTAMIRNELRAMIGTARNIELLERDLTDDEVLRLQQRHDVCLSLHRAEGFGLTICEMLELGKPAVATGWSGNVEFMRKYPNACPVGYRLVPYQDYLRRYPGYMGDWAEADTDDAARILRSVATRHQEGRRLPELAERRAS